MGTQFELDDPQQFINVETGIFLGVLETDWRKIVGPIFI